MSAIRTRPVPCKPGDHELVWDDAAGGLRCQVCGRPVRTIVDDLEHDYWAVTRYDTVGQRR